MIGPDIKEIIRDYAVPYSIALVSATTIIGGYLIYRMKKTLDNRKKEPQKQSKLENEVKGGSE